MHLGKKINKNKINKKKFLIKKNTSRSLQWLRGPHKNVNIELETIKLNIQSTMSSHQDNNLPSYDNKKETFIFFKSFSKCLKNIKKSAEDKRFHKPLFIVGGLIIFQRFTGKLFS